MSRMEGLQPAQVLLISIFLLGPVLLLNSCHIAMISTFHRGKSGGNPESQWPSFTIPALSDSKQRTRTRFALPSIRQKSFSQSIFNEMGRTALLDYTAGSYISFCSVHLTQWEMAILRLSLYLIH